MQSILIVDDEKEILKILERFISLMNFEVDTADHWEAALAKVKESAFDLIFLDIHMPGKNGFEIAKTIRQTHPDQKIVIITGLEAGQVFDYYRQQDVDFNDILYKPFNFEKVKAIISNVL